jgi:hypothetical protein
VTGIILRTLRAITGRRRTADPAVIAQLEWQNSWDSAAAAVRAAIEASWREQGLDPADPVLLRALNVEVEKSMAQAHWEKISGQVGEKISGQVGGRLEFE